MTLSDKIAKQIFDLLEKSDGGETEIQRNNLATLIGCVPSQINYVITSRFTPENGYVVLSRRGGGGYIRITRVSSEKNLLLMHIVNSLSDAVDMQSLCAILQSLGVTGAITAGQAELILAACSDNALRPAEPHQRDILRASIAKQLFIKIGSKE